MPRLYFVRMTYLAQVRIARARDQWRTRWRRAVRASEAAPPETTAPPMGGLADVIALAASGQARLEVTTVGVTLATGPAMQRWVALESSPGHPLPTLAVIVQGQGREGAGAARPT